MIPRKKRIAILISIIVLITLIIVGILGTILYLKTDIFKSNEELFIKYFLQNSKAFEILKSEDALGIENTLDTNKYTSELIGKIDYTENIGTSDENKNSAINDVEIKINSTVDKINEYDYKDILIGTDSEDLVKLEYLKQNQTYAVRLNGIKQFVSKDDTENIGDLLNSIDISSTLNFSEEEKENLLNTYIGILQQNVSKDKYYKQTNSQITMDNQGVVVNEYYIKFTIEEFNNLYIKFLEQIKQDEIILTKIDLIENKIKESYSEYEQEESLRDTFINTINDQIEEIKNNNIGNEEVRIVVYENNGNIVRTSIEKNTNKIMIDFKNASSIEIHNIQISESTNEKNIKIEKNINENQSNFLMGFEEIQDNEQINKIEFDYQQSVQDNQIFKNIKLGIANEKYEGILDIEENIEIKQQFENQITLETDNVRFEDLDEEQSNVITDILTQNIQAQLSNLYSVVDLNEYITMLQNLQIVKNNTVEIPEDTGEATEIEIKRFNSQFEFFVSENLTSDNIKEMMQIVENNFNDMGVLLKTGEVEYLNLELLESEEQEADDYNESIEEILIIIKENSKNEEKQNELLKFLDINKDNKYTISLEYDDNGFVNIIRMKIQEK